MYCETTHGLLHLWTDALGNQTRAGKQLLETLSSKHTGEEFRAALADANGARDYATRVKGHLLTHRTLHGCGLPDASESTP